MPKRKVYEPNVPRPPKKRGPKKIYGDEPVVSIMLRISKRQWEKLLNVAPRELRRKKIDVIRWLIDEKIGNY